MTKLEMAQRCKELANEVIKPWLEIHGAVLDVDGCHNRIHGLGIKHYSFKASDAIRKLSKSFEDEWNRDQKGKFISTNESDDIPAEEIED